MGEANKYAEYYSVFGLEEMIKEAAEKVKRKKAELDDVGNNWTTLHIENHRVAIREEIAIIEMEIEELKQALEIKRRP